MSDPYKPPEFYYFLPLSIWQIADLPATDRERYYERYEQNMAYRPPNEPHVPLETIMHLVSILVSHNERTERFVEYQTPHFFPMEPHEIAELSRYERERYFAEYDDQLKHMGPHLHPMPTAELKQLVMQILYRREGRS